MKNLKNIVYKGGDCMKKFMSNLQNSVKKITKPKRKKHINKVSKAKREKIEVVIEKRYKVLIGIILALMTILTTKLFYMQAIKYNHYETKLKKLTEDVKQEKKMGYLVDQQALLQFVLKLKHL